jgi:hypothetical protein
VLYDIGDLVLLESTNITPENQAERPSQKLCPKYIGPYPVVEIISDVSYRLELPPNMKIHNVFHVALLK